MVRIVLSAVTESKSESLDDEVKHSDSSAHILPSREAKNCTVLFLQYKDTLQKMDDFDVILFQIY